MSSTAHRRSRYAALAACATSARAHSIAMDRDRKLSHQPGERNFANRISATGYNWSAVGENIGWTTSTSRYGVGMLAYAMYDEKAPNDGHRRNILSRIYRQVGIGVVYDARAHRVWLTEDFGRAR